MSEYGKVALVGAGPGDIGLLSLRGAELIKNADCIIYDRLISLDILDLAGEKTEKIYVGKENHHHVMDQDSINELLLQKAGQYELVVRLKGGDPYVFGRGGEEALFLTEKEVNVEVVPGITSSISVAELAGIPVTHRGLSKGFEVITAHSRQDALSQIEYSKLTDEDITLVFLMGLSHVADIANRLIEAGRASDTEIAVISKGAPPRQKKCIGTLETIASKVQEAGLTSPAVIIVGKVVSLSDTLSFFEQRPFFGYKFFLPEIIKYEYSWNGDIRKKPNELKTKLKSMGAEVITVTAGTITPIEIDLSFLDDINPDDYLVFTSASGVEAFIYNLIRSDKDLRALPKCRIAAVGDKTAGALLRYGIRADVVSEVFSVEGLSHMLKGKEPGRTNLYFLSGKRHTNISADDIGLDVDIKTIICYENVLNKADITEAEKEAIRDCDGTILTCGSNARYAVNLIGSLPGRIYSIGPSCSRVLRELGIEEILEAAESNYDGLMSIVQNSFDGSAK